MQAPENIQHLAAERLAARASKDFAQADALRDEIAAAGWKVIDTPDGFELVTAPPFDVFPTLAALAGSVHVEAPVVIAVLLDGWATDADTCVAALLEHAPADAAIMLMDMGNVDEVGVRAEEWARKHPGRVHACHIEQTLDQAGWANAVSTAIDISSGEFFATMDMSTVIEGDAFTPMLDVLRDTDAVGTGWKGVNVDTDDAWRSFVSVDAGEVDAILGYMMVFERTAIVQVRPDAKARFYRNADMEWSLAIREAGGRLRIPDVALPLRQDRHHGYHDSDPTYREKQSKKTYDRLLQRFRGRDDILAPR